MVEIVLVAYLSLSAITFGVIFPILYGSIGKGQRVWKRK